MPVERMWRSHDLKPSYDVVIIGAGVHGLAIAYYLGKRGITNVAVLDKGYLGGGASGRNTAIIRSNYRTPQGVAFYDESVKLYERLALSVTRLSSPGIRRLVGPSRPGTFPPARLVRTLRRSPTHTSFVTP